MKYKLLFFGFLALATAAAVCARPQHDDDSSAFRNTVILVIRHAEKPEKGSSLSSEGKARAKAYVKYFKDFTIDGHPLKLDCLVAARDSSTSHRPRLTIEPTAKALGLKIDSRFDDDQAPKLIREFQSRPCGTNILICWHHGEIPQLLHALGADPKKLLPRSQWPDDVFGWLIQLRYDENGHLYESKRINENLLPGDSANPEPPNP